MDVWRSYCLTPLFKQDHLEQVDQNCVHRAFQYLQGGKLHILSGQLATVLSHPHTKKEFPDVHKEHSTFQFVSIAS